MHVRLCFHSRCYSPHGAYAQSKLALVLFTYHMQRLLAAQGSPVTANVVDPGVVNTDLYKHVFWGTRLIKKLFGWWFFKVSLPRCSAVPASEVPGPTGRRPPRGHLIRRWASSPKREHPGVPVADVGSQQPGLPVCVFEHLLVFFSAKEKVDLGTEDRAQLCATTRDSHVTHVFLNQSVVDCRMQFLQGRPVAWVLLLESRRPLLSARAWEGHRLALSLPK